MAEHLTALGRSEARTLLKLYEEDQGSFVALVNDWISQGRSKDLQQIEARVPVDRRDDFTAQIWAIASSVLDEDYPSDEEFVARLWLMPVKSLEPLLDADRISDAVEEAWFNALPEMSVRCGPIVMLPQQPLDFHRIKMALEGTMMGSMPQGWATVEPSEWGLLPIVVTTELEEDIHWRPGAEGFEDAASYLQRRLVTEGLVVEAGRLMDPGSLAPLGSATWQGLPEERDLRSSLDRFFSLAGRGASVRPALDALNSGEIMVQAISETGVVLDEIRIDAWQEGVSLWKLTQLALQAAESQEVVPCVRPELFQLRHRPPMIPRAGKKPSLAHLTIAPRTLGQSSITPFDPDAMRPRGSPFICRDTRPGSDRRFRGYSR